MNAPPLEKALPLRQISKLNDKIAIRSNQVFATMGFFWFCLIFSLLPLRWPGVMPFVQYASSGVLQLIALPLLGVGTLLAARSSDQLAKEQHDAVLDTMQNMHTLIQEIRQLHVELTAKVTARMDDES